MAHVDDLETRRANMGFIRNSMSAPLLSRDREFALTTAWHDRRDIAALHELVIAYTRLVVATASRMRSYGLPIGDLVQEGTIGLMQATQRFDPDRDVRFSTYAAWWIRAAIQDYVLRNWSIVRTGTTAAQKTLFFNLRRLRGRIEDSSGSIWSRSNAWNSDWRPMISRWMRHSMGTAMGRGRIFSPIRGRHRKRR
jgi:RNA polymerase sigma-32 factor